ncbi:ABC transporter permease subunit [Rhizobium rhizogenes]|nr:MULTISPECIES: ABC transporter permease subunit [Rhizobium]NTI24443.1 ABC transporter permease subunit [Rhizobium rhizogenes]NTI43763.1 ABC transporter permease subunit [Rhizobium rhizogenes]NTI63738.1 ABC transporter permease subunit [Rhizobium rhizogenes]QTG08192.1 ABC transporter permease subunit [Rhizobium rhizogenes]
MASTRSPLFAPAISFGTIVGVLAVMQGLIMAEVINPYIVPLPTDIAASLWRVVVEEGIPGRFAVTVGETLAAGLLILLVGMPIGLLLYRFGRLRLAFEPWLAAMAAAPLVLAYPLFLVLFGRSSLTIIVIGFAAGVAPVALKTIEGFASTRRVLIDVGRSFRLTPAQEFRKILLPAALPQIFVGLRLGLIFCLINVVGVEFLINLGGLGQLINDLAERYDLPGTYAAICFVVLVSILFFAILDRGEKWLQRRG